jgi:hypothetical protein
MKCIYAARKHKFFYELSASRLLIFFSRALLLIFYAILYLSGENAKKCVMHESKLIDDDDDDGMCTCRVLMLRIAACQAYDFVFKEIFHMCE